MPLLNYKQLGQGPDLILIHGLFGSLENLNMVAKPLSSQFRITSIDVRNHGNSFHSESMNYQEMANDVIELMDYLEISSAAILGHSMGGKIAMQVALNTSARVNKLIVADISPVTYQPHHTEILAGLNSLNLSELTKRSDADKALSAYVPELGVRQFLLKNINFNANGSQFKCNLKAITHCYNDILQWHDSSQTYDKEALFIKGGNSDYILPEYRNAINKQFPMAKAKIIQGAGHWLHAEKTLAFNKIVTDFLSI